ncbi:hypothetical protein HJG60_009729 [Phyllostomus discolor]|uniref:SPATA31-like domain-containing protein n=1 Tax=Phyllostomus discolor TaxID=89673 RepID=A0A834BC33_9CHIR|nr:hypothetical protein HJG60_009729 [Phyllostomus discolor]
MTFSQFLNSLSELYLTFSESLDCNHTLIYISVLWFLLLLFYFLVNISTFWESEPTRKCRGRPKRTRKSRKLKGCRYYQREQEEKKVLISILKSPIGQHHDSTHFRQLLCPDSSCEWTILHPNPFTLPLGHHMTVIVQMLLSNQKTL